MRSNDEDLVVRAGALISPQSHGLPDSESISRAPPSTPLRRPVSPCRCVCPANSGKLSVSRGIFPNKCRVRWFTLERRYSKQFEKTGRTRSKKKDTFPCPFPGCSPGAKQEEQTDYALIITPADFAFRKATNANPSRPVPRSKRLLGSGAGTSIGSLPTAESWSVTGPTP